jgi:hypothetical protein
LTQLSKLFVFASLAGALAFESWQGRFAYPYLPALAATSALAAAIGGRFAPRRTAATILVVAYWFPVLFVAATRRPFLPPFFVVWSSALAGLVAGDPDALTWSYPRRWRFALVLWALSVALVWPIVAAREADFAPFALVERYRVSNTGIGGSPTLMVSWTADVVILHLLGLLWFDWLFRRLKDGVDDVRRWIAWPLALGGSTGALLALYQGAVDLGFLSGGVWPSMGRAAGPLLDGNAAGMMAALWSAGVLAFADDRRARPCAILGALVCWGGLWMTGSRTALLAALIALSPLGLLAIRRAGGFRRRRRELAIGAVAAAAVFMTLVFAPIRSPLQRLRYMPTFAGDAGVDWLVREVWDRSSYGGAAGTLIAQHPAVGIGLGMFHMMGADYIRMHLHQVPPDNAQNWWRHNIVELGGMGAAGLVIWSVLFAAYLYRTGGRGENAVPAAAIKGALVAIGLASLMGMPAQSLPIALTFWTFAFWYFRLVDDGSAASGPRLSRAAWIVISVWLAAYLGFTIVEGRRALRPAERALDGDWPYMYGMYEPPLAPAERVRALWTEARGVAIIAVDGPTLVLTVRAAHPDITEHPVRAVVTVNGKIAVDTKLYTDVPIVKTIEGVTGRRAILEARVDRTWRSADESSAHPDVGLALSWRFQGNQSGRLRESAPFAADDRVVEIGEQAIVQAIDVRVDRARSMEHVTRKAGDIDSLEPSAFRNRRAEVDVDVLEPCSNREELERLGMERPHVRDVPDVALEERDPACRVDGLENDRGAGPQFRVRGFENPHQILGLQVFDDLKRCHTA